MCEALYELFADELIKREAAGRQAGEKIGEKQGEQCGEAKMSNLILRLIDDNRSAEIERMASDAAFRASLMKQYHLN